MGRTNISETRIKPEGTELLTLHVLRRERVSESFARVTLGGGDIGKFRYMGFDQWFRLFIPVAEDSLSRLPNKFNTLAYAKYLAISKTSRPVLRNYSVSGYRADGQEGPELDVDFVLHGSQETGDAGPAAKWALSCSPGDAVAIFDEGVGFNPEASLRDVFLVSDETGLPAAAGVLASLPTEAAGTAIIEVPAVDDRRDLPAPAGIEVRWIVRTAGNAMPGSAVLAAVRDMPVPATPFYGWAVGEQALATGVRRHWTRNGVPKENIMFCGYWRNKH